MARLLSTPQSLLMTPFTKKVLGLIKKIPKGQVATYGQIAKLAGKPQGSRGVGWILNSCTDTHRLPWQRVINSKGKISFPRDTKEYVRQKRLLLKEKIKFDENDVVSLKIYGWKKTPPKIKAKNGSRVHMFS